MNRSILVGLLSLSLSAAFAPAWGSVNSLVNPGFESGTAGWDWNPATHAYPYPAANYPLNTTAKEGTRVAQFYTLPSTTLSTSQLITSGVLPGQTWTFSGHVMNVPGYEVDVDSLSRVRIEYVGGAGGSFTLEPDIQSSALGTWIPFSLTASSPTPEGITGIRFWAEFVQSPNNSGILLYDDMSAISEVPEVGTGLIAAGVAGLAIVVRGVRSRRR